MELIDQFIIILYLNPYASIQLLLILLYHQNNQILFNHKDVLYNYLVKNNLLTIYIVYINTY